jgi:hypothetical protein
MAIVFVILRSVVGPAVSGPLARPPPPPVCKIDSLTIAEVPPLFEQLHTKHFNLVWRGGRDSSGSDEFHHFYNPHGERRGKKPFESRADSP